MLDDHEFQNIDMCYRQLCPLTSRGTVWRYRSVAAHSFQPNAICCVSEPPRYRSKPIASTR
jgi:hypothetical protein